MIRLLVGVLVGLLALSGCQAAPGQAAPDGTWRLEAFGAPFAPEPGDPTVTTTLELRAGDVGGSTGVNNLSGTYRRTASGELEFPDLAVTERAGPAAAMAQEARFVAALQATRRYELTGDRLVLASRDNEALLYLRR